MPLALSAMAFAGAPAHVPPDCTGRTFVQDGANPAISCHIDLTQGNFNAQAIADSIGQVRGKVLGCTYELPVPEGGAPVDRERVNVRLTTGGSTRSLCRRRDPMNPCQNDGCWDYDADGTIELLGKACAEVKAAGDAKVRIAVGCVTVLG